MAPLTVRFDPLVKDIQLYLDEALSPQARSQMLAEFARDALADADETNEAALGYKPPHITTVDGSTGANENAVRPDGQIHYEFQLQNDVVDFVYKALLLASPVKTGRYRRSHMLFAGDQPMDEPDESITSEEWTIVNTQPYARKIERGLSQQAPDGVYQAVATLAAARYGNLAKIRFVYRALADMGSAGLVVWARGHTAGVSRTRNLSTRQAQRQFLKDTRNPAILITFR